MPSQNLPAVCSAYRQEIDRILEPDIPQAVQVISLRHIESQPISRRSHFESRFCQNSVFVGWGS